MVVCLSVCQSVTQHLTSRAMNHSTKNTTYSGQVWVEKYVGFSLKLLRSKVTVWNTSEKANMEITTGLPQPHSACSRTVEATEVTTVGEYRVSLCYLTLVRLRELARDHDTSKTWQLGPAHQLTVPPCTCAMHVLRYPHASSTPRVCTVGFSPVNACIPSKVYANSHQNCTKTIYRYCWK